MTTDLHEPALVKAAFQIQAFIRTKHQFVDIIPAGFFDLVDYIAENNERPNDLVPSSNKATTKSASVEPGTTLLPYPAEWAVDKSRFRLDLEHFATATAEIDRQRRSVSELTDERTTTPPNSSTTFKVPQAPVKSKAVPGNSHRRAQSTSAAGNTAAGQDSAATSNNQEPRSLVNQERRSQDKDKNTQNTRTMASFTEDQFERLMAAVLRQPEQP